MKKLPYFLVVLAVLSFFILMNREEKIVQEVLPINKISYVEIANQKIKVEVVSTPEARAQGLSGRLSLALDEGMLFVFDYPDKYSFWMKDMNFPIDMIWIDENLKIIYIKENAEPESYPKVFGPKEDSKYVLEVVSGFSAKYNIKEGDSITFTLATKNPSI